MRDKKRIKNFCDEFAEIWENECPDWRFAQLVLNVLGSYKRDPFFLEEKEVIEVFKRYFKIINDPILILMGGTASGKDTVQKELRYRNFDKIVTYTTRIKREHEIDGVDYNFVSNEMFQKMEEYMFAETSVYHTVYGDWYYGSPIGEYLTNTSRRSVILTPDGVRKVIPILKSHGIKTVVIYLKAPEDIIKDRLIRRGDNKEEAERRIQADKNDFADLSGINYHIVDSNKFVKDLADEIIGIYEGCLNE